jgi:hypothetical protein
LGEGAYFKGDQERLERDLDRYGYTPGSANKAHDTIIQSKQLKSTVFCYFYYELFIQKEILKGT